MAIEIKVQKSKREDFGDVDLVYVSAPRKQAIAFSDLEAAMRGVRSVAEMLQQQEEGGR